MGAALLEFDGIHVTRGSFALSADLTISKGARVAVIGPMVEPQGTSLWETNSWNGTPATPHQRANAASPPASVA